MKKKKIIVLCAVIAAAIAAAAAAGLAFGLAGRKSPVTDEKSEYGYSIRENGRKTVITVKEGEGGGYTWKPSGYDSDIVSVSVRGNKITVVPRAFGVTVLSLFLEKEGSIIPDRKYAIYVSLNVDSDMVLTASSSYTSAMTTVRSDESSPVSYVLVTDGSGCITLAVAAGNPDDITAEYSDRSLVYADRLDSDGYVRFDIVPIADGQSSFFAADTEKKKAVRLDISKAENETVPAFSHSVVDYDIQADELSEEEKEARKYVGRISFPEGIVPYKCRTSVVSEKEHVVMYDTAEGDREYDFAVSLDITLAQLRERYNKYAVTDEKDVKVGALPGVSYKSGVYFYVAWNTANGASFLVYSKSDDVLAVAERFAASNPAPSVG